MVGYSCDACAVVKISNLFVNVCMSYEINIYALASLQLKIIIVEKNYDT